MIKRGLITGLGYGLRRLVKQRPPVSGPGRIVVLKPCCLGDVILATPTIAALARRFPQADIDVVVGSWSRAVLENNPHVRQVIDAGPVGQGGYGPRAVWRLARQLKGNRYELAVTLDRSPLVGLVPRLAGIPCRVGLDSMGRGFAHTLRAPVPLQPCHEAEIYLSCAVALGVADAASFRAEFFPAPADRAALPSFEAPLVILHPGGGVNPGMRMLNKRWPPARFAALADRFAGRGLAVALGGAAGDALLCEQIAAQTTKTRPAILAGQLSLGQFGALCQRAALFVGGDTGAMHLAVAVGCKTVAIFGPTDPRRYGPFAPPEQARVVWQPVSVPAGGVGQGPTPRFSWQNTALVEEVWQVCQALL